MSKTGVEGDLEYVKSVVGRADEAGSPAGIYYLWAVLCFVGMSLIDVRPQAAGPFWAIAGPLGGLASGYIGWRASRAIGQGAGRDGFQHALHWLGMMCAIFLMVPLEATGKISHNVFPSLVLLILAFSYYVAGIYLDRRLLPVGIVMAACYVVTVLVKEWRFMWTFTGTVLAASLVVSGLFARAAWKKAAAGDTP